uniref:Ovule protein n=1 Tax=Parascaris equorum TaxID=6256 RepID=A0A914RCG9_PAREQ
MLVGSFIVSSMEYNPMGLWLTMNQWVSKMIHIIHFLRKQFPVIMYLERLWLILNRLQLVGFLLLHNFSSIYTSLYYHH